MFDSFFMNRFAEYPFVRALIPFIAGILFAIHISPLNSFFQLLFFVFLAYYVIDFFVVKYFDQYDRRIWNGIYLSVLFFFFGMFWTTNLNDFKSSNHYKNLIQKENKCIVEVCEVPQLKERTIKVVAKVNSIRDKGEWMKTKGYILLYFKKDELARKIKYGDKLIIASRIQEIPSPKNPGEFNYKRYCFFHGFYHQSFLKSDQWKIIDDSGSFIKRLAIENRNKLLRLLNTIGLENQEYAVASALILGYTDDLNAETKSAFSSSGALHVLAVSGLHVAIIYALLDKLLMFLNYFKKGNYLKAILIIIFLWLYALITGLSPSVIRAATMLSFIVVAKTINRNANIYNTIAASAFTILCFNPFIIMEVGFQLSYLAVIGIIFLQPKIYQALYFRNKILDFIWNISAVSIAAQIATFPLGILYFHQFPNYFLLSNLIVIPLGTLILYIGILSFIFYSVPYIGDGFSVLLKFLVKLLNTSVAWIEDLPYSISNGFSISSIEAIVMYLIIILFISFVFYKKSIWLKLTFCFITLLFIGFTIKKWNQLYQRNVTFYSINNEFAIDFIEGKSNLFLTTANFLRNKSKVQFHIQPNWIQKGLKVMDTLVLPIRLKNNSNFFRYHHFYAFNGFKIFHWDSTVHLRKSFERIRVNTILVSHNSYIDSSLLFNNFEFDELILDGTNSPYHVENIKRKFGRKFKVIDLLKNGAYEKKI